MFLDIVVVDFLSPDGVLTTYRVVPKQFGNVIIDRLRDVQPDRLNEADVDLGGVRLYHSADYEIQSTASRPRAVRFDHATGHLDFQFEHLGIPVGSFKHAHGGVYNLLLAPGWRAINLYVSDPYDKSTDDPTQKKQFRYDVFWDPACFTQMVEVLLQSGRGSFSLIIGGSAEPYSNTSATFVSAAEHSQSISGLMGGHLALPPDAEKALADDLVAKSEWLELKPNFFGIGLNLNAIVRDAVGFFRRRMRSSKQAV